MMREIILEGVTFRIPKYSHKRALRDAIKIGKQIASNVSDPSYNTPRRVAALIANDAFLAAADTICGFADVKTGDDWHNLSDRHIAEQTFGKSDGVKLGLPMLLTLKMMNDCAT